MTPRQLDLAYEFCEKVSSDDLLDYLGLAADASADEARAALKAKRRKMQGMQSNPKFRDEARLLIRNFQALDAVLVEPATHVRDMARRRESSHLPILEMTIRGVLAGGPLSSEQEAYLRTNAAELGVSARTFDTLLRRLQQESKTEGSDTPRSGPSRGDVPIIDFGAEDDGSGSAPIPGEALGFDMGNLGDFDIDLSASASGAPPREHAAEKRPLKARTGTPVSRPGGRRQPTPTEDSGRSSGRKGRSLRGPGVVPVRPREDASDLPSVTSAATAPPVRIRTAAPADTDPSTAKRQLRPDGNASLAGGMEIVGDPVRYVEVVGRRPAEITVRVRLLGELPVAARVTADDPWLAVAPDRLSPRQREHLLTVTVLPDKMYNDEDQSAVRLFNDLGEQVEVAIKAKRNVNWNGLFVGIAAVTGLAAMALAVWWIVSFFAPNNAAFLQVVVDPTAEAILLDGDKIGSGELARLDTPAAGTHKLTVVQRNFKTYEAEITLARDEGRTVDVRLELGSKLDFRPRPDETRGKIADPHALDDVRRRMEKCTASTPRDRPPYKLAVTLLFVGDGSVGAVRMASDDEVPTPVAICLRRVAAAAEVSVLQGSWTDVTMDVSYP